tara:strand:+ start:246 stop:734 length:489 start_codon:yes stop_codon:yes gene_type:complete
MISFLELIRIESLTWRYRVRLGWNLSSILRLLHVQIEEEKENEGSAVGLLTYRSVYLDENYAAFFRRDRVNFRRKKDKTQNFEEDVWNLGVILSLIVTGGSSLEIIPPLAPASTEEAKELEVAISKRILPGCHPLLEALVYQCLSFENVPTALQCAEELQMM